MNILKDTTIQHSLDVLYSTYHSLFNDLGITATATNTNVPYIPSTPSSSDSQPSSTTITSNIDQQFKPNLFHPYSPGNIDERCNTLQRLLETMKLTFAQYRQWEGDKDLQKLLTNQRQYVSTNLKLKQMLKTNADCTLLGKIHLESISKDSYRRLGLLICRLSETMTDLDNRYGSYSDLHELTALAKTDPAEISPDQVYSCNISSSTFLLDIFINGDGTVKEVKLVHISMATGEDKETDESINNELTTALRNNIKEFDAKIRRICQQDLLFRKFQHVNLQQALQVLQDDFLSIGKKHQEQQQQQAIDIGDELELFNSGYGKISLDICGVKSVYYTTLQQRLSHEGQYSLTLDIEEGSRTSMYQLTLTSQLSEDGLSFIPHQQQQQQIQNEQQDVNSLINSNVRLVVKLDPPINITIGTMTELLQCVGVKSNPTASSSTNPNAMLENQLVVSNCSNGKNSSSSSNTQNNNNNNNSNTLEQNDITVLGDRQRYFYTGGEYHPGIEVSRIPIEHCSQLLPVLQILRQQIVFNLLFKSCFTACPFTNKPTSTTNSSSEVDSDSMNIEQQQKQSPSSSPLPSLTTTTTTTTISSNQDIPVFEVMVQPPFSISITFLQPNKIDFNSVDIQIGPGGYITATIDNPTDDQPLCSNEYLTQLLNASKSIPITFSYLFKSSTTTTNEESMSI
ncbi:putative mediator complex subunit 1 [Heterostelium album PN500]|uniref:Mediator of RNA polymerase II transcription subunit 1 n=1 Tax=Heterostelium pallidum (strain ATCC 26659 / Pp 5 / PN500) TaxID=670386 RepID=D3BU93_HETP5|nr:putative mediator complex subunit 1 [Heterostelium album PN500]EFA75027.1 putative mediator complex subunit 1 [Heterostelium album PN500]|eukprot:XP_020427161.1 putative mediator complex subunit 1 [Heterostelium album PN500]